MYSINNVFDKVYLINLEQDTDKYQTMKNKYKHTKTINKQHKLNEKHAGQAHKH